MWLLDLQVSSVQQEVCLSPLFSIVGPYQGWTHVGPIGSVPVCTEVSTYVLYTYTDVHTNRIRAVWVYEKIFLEFPFASGLTTAWRLQPRQGGLGQIERGC